MSRLTELLVPDQDILVPRGLPTTHSYPVADGADTTSALPLSAWTLGSATLHHLRQQLAQRNPSTIVEFGAGVSTIVIAAFCKASGHAGSYRPHVFSLEQDSNEAKRINAALSDRDLSEFATVFHAPLVPRHVNGQDVMSYDLGASGLIEAIAARSVDFLVIDGPAGPAGTRIETLLGVLPYCADDAYWLLDDALRPGEIWVLQEWSRRRSVRQLRILQVDKGIAEGQVRLPEHAAGQLAV